MPVQLEFFSQSLDKKKFMEDFISFPHKLFAHDSLVKKLPFELEAHYFKMHPLKHDFFLIKKDNQILLRSMMCLTPHKDTAYFGLLDFDYQNESISEILKLFKETLINWSKEEGVKKVLGPINFSTWLPYRLLSKVEGGPRFSFEPDRPLEYCDLLKAHGFTTNQLFSSKGYAETENFINLTKSDFDKSKELGFSLEFMPKELNIEDLRDLHRLSVKIFDDNYLATPIDFDTFKTLYAANAKKDDYTYSLFIKTKEGERIGYFINFIEHGHCVVKTIGIDKQYRGCGLSNGSMHLSLKKAQGDGVDKMVAAMVKEGAQSESYGRKMKHLWTHLYEILEIDIM